MKLYGNIIRIANKSVDSRGRNQFTTKVKYDCHMLIFTQLKPAQQPFVNNPYSKCHENPPNGFGADMWS
jgi:hypothetical protein